MSKASLRVFCVSLAVSTACLALSRDDLLFYAPLKGSPQPAFAKGNAAPAIKGKLQFVGDAARQGLLTGGPEADLSFETAGNMLLDAGTVAMWAKPVGWSTDTTLRFFMRVGEDADAGGPGEGAFLWFYKYFTYPVWLLVQQTYQQREVFLTGPGSGDSGGIYAFAWKDARWDHIAATWHLNEMRVYVNGHYCGTAMTETPRLLRKLGKSFYIGGPNQQNTADLVLSDFFVFNRPLTGEELADLAAKGEAALDGKPVLPRLEAACDFLPGLDRLHVRASVVGRRPQDAGNLRLALTLESQATGQPVAFDRAVTPLTATRYETDLETRDLPPGTYRLLATLLAGPDVAGQASADFEKPKTPEWLGNKIGVPTKVPKPWSPLEQKGDSVSCWGRTYQWQNTLLPTQVVTQELPVLARPIDLVAQIDGKPVRLGPASVALKTTPMKADVTAQAALGPLSVQAETWVEYDGFVWTRLRVSGPAALERLSLEIPYRAENATLWHANIAPGHLSGKARPVRLAIVGEPYSWLGNATGGLQWCTDRPHAWPVAQKDRMLEIEPGEKETIFRVTFIDGKRTMAEPFEVAFGLMATPVRPYPENWRELEPLNCWWTQWTIQNEHQRDGPCGYPVASPDGKWKPICDELTKRAGKPPFPYMCLGTFWRGAPEYRTFRSEWVTGNTAPPPLDLTADAWAGAGVCPEAKSFVDWRIWRVNKTFTENPDLVKSIRGMYLDVTSAPACGNIAHGCGVRTADGTLIKRYGILGMREFQKRLYCLLQEKWPSLLIINHESGAMHMSQLAFSHLMVDGESTFHLPPLTLEKMNYYDLLKFEDWRSEYMGINYGTVPVFLPQPARQAEGKKELWANVMGPTGIPASQHLVGMLLAHDIIPWPAYMNPEPFTRLSKMKDAFGWDRQVQFTGYWAKDSPVQLESDRQPVQVSVYRRPGKALIVVMNDSDQSASVRLRPDWAKLGLKPAAQLTDLYGAAAFEFETVDVDAYLAGKGESVRKKYSSPAAATLTVPVTDGVAAFVVAKRNFRALAAE